MQDRHLAAKYAPIIHCDTAESIPLVAVGYTVFREEKRSDSFPRRTVAPDECGLVIEYALYWDWDIQHLYDLEHIWVYVAADGRVTRAEGSFHGKYLTLWETEMPFALPPEGVRIHAFCQPGKHAFLPEGQLFRLIPGWQECCMEEAGGPVLVGGPFEGVYCPTPEEDAASLRVLREKYAFSPTLAFDEGRPLSEGLLRPWPELKVWIPGRIAEICQTILSQEANP